MKRKSKILLISLSLILLFLITSDGLMTAASGRDPFKDTYFLNMFDNFFGKFENKLKFLEDPPIFPGLSRHSDSIVVSLAPSNTYWSQIDKGDSNCNLPEGKMSAGDIITDCSGTVILVYTPADQTLGIWEFGIEENDSSEDSTPEDTNPDADDEDNTNNTDDKPDIEIINPTLKITKPERGAFYILNNKKFSTEFTKIIGDINIEVKIENPSNLNISSVKFYINDEYIHKDEKEPYSFFWNQKLINKHRIIRVVAIDENLNEICEDELMVVITNFGIL